MTRQKLQERGKDIRDGFFHGYLDKSEAAIVREFRNSGLDPRELEWRPIQQLLDD